MALIAITMATSHALSPPLQLSDLGTLPTSVSNRPAVGLAIQASPAKCPTRSVTFSVRVYFRFGAEHVGKAPVVDSSPLIHVFDNKPLKACRLQRLHQLCTRSFLAELADLHRQFDCSPVQIAGKLMRQHGCRLTSSGVVCIRYHQVWRSVGGLYTQPVRHRLPPTGEYTT